MDTLNTLRQDDGDALLLQSLDRYLALAESERVAFLAALAEAHPTTAQRLTAITAHALDDFPEPPLPLVAEAHGGPAWLGPYQVTGLLGEGGMGRVFHATAPDGEPVAVKVLGDWLNHPDFRRRFRRETAILQRLDHRHIVPLHDAGFLHDGTPYLVLAFVDGDALKVHLREGDVDLQERLRWFDQLCEAVGAAHQQGIVHRDLKPSNVLIDDQRCAVLLDFGIAKILAHTEGSEATQTQTRLRLMSLPYAAPEQVTGAPIDVTTDVYLLGVLLYEMLTGCLPYGTQATTARQWEWAIVHATPLPPSQAASNWMPSRRTDKGTLVTWPPPADWDAVLEKALAKEPTRRYATVAALRTAVRRLATGQSLQPAFPGWSYTVPGALSQQRRRPNNGVSLGLQYLAESVSLPLDGVNGHCPRAQAYWLRLAAETLENLAFRGAAGASPALADILAELPLAVAANPPRGAAQIGAALQLARQMINLGLAESAALVLNEIEERRVAGGAYRSEWLLLGAFVALTGGDYDCAATRLTHADACLSEQGDVAGRVEWWFLQGRLAAGRGAWPEAVSAFEQALTLLDGRSTATVSPACCYNELGLLMMRRKAADQALTWFQCALTHAGASEAPINRIAALQNLAQAYLALGDVAGAVDYFEQTLSQVRQALSDDAPLVCFLRNNLHLLYQMGGLGSSENQRPLPMTFFAGRRFLLAPAELLELSRQTH